MALALFGLFQIVNISNPNGNPRIYTVVGNICETDTFAWDRKLYEVREGDYLVFYNAGAYGFEMSSNFNSRLKPAEEMVKEGKVKMSVVDEAVRRILKKKFETIKRARAEIPISLSAWNSFHWRVEGNL